jgi:hypothetical protein
MARVTGMWLVGCRYCRVLLPVVGVDWFFWPGMNWDDLK